MPPKMGTQSVTGDSSELQPLTDLKHVIRTCEADKISTDDEAVEPAASAIQNSLPHDITINILSRLPVKSLARFRCVRKQWLSLTYDAYFVGEQQKKARDKFPQILSSDIIEKKMTLFSLNLGGDVEDSTYEIGGWNMLSHKLSNSVNGLAFAYGIEKTGRNFYLLNPSTQEYSDLPMTRQEDFQEESFGFGFDSSSGEYKVVRIFSPEGPVTYYGVEILTLGTAGWRYIEETLPIEFNRPVFVNGYLYWKAFFPAGGGFCAVVLSFDIKNEKFDVIEAPNPEYWRRGYIIVKELEGHICTVAIIRRAKPQMRIWKLMDGSEWVKMYDIELELDYEANPFRLQTVIGIVGKMLLLEVLNEASFAVEVFCYDLQKGTLHQFLQEATPELLIHEESLVSPRKLLRDLNE